MLKRRTQKKMPLVFSLFMLGVLSAPLQSANAQSIRGSFVLADAGSERQRLLDGLVGKNFRSGSGPGLGRTRGIVLGAPTPDNSQQKQILKNILRKSQTRAPALPAPRQLDNKKGGAVANTPPVAPAMTNTDRQQLAKIVKDSQLPAVDLEIYFKYNSADLNPRSLPDLVRLGQVLIDPKLKGSTFLVAGHTDARGGDRYNLSLSERRARSVQDFLRRTFHIKADTLVPVGYGKEQLKNPGNPFAAENRRVQIVNLSVLK